MVIDAQFFVGEGGSVVVVSAELRGSVVVQLLEVKPVDRPRWHSHVVRDNFMFSHKVLALNTPSYSARDASDFANDCRLVVDSVFLRTHLVCKEALVGGLIDSRLRIIDRFL